MNLHAEVGGVYYEDAEVFVDADRGWAPEAILAVQIEYLVPPPVGVQ